MDRRTKKQIENDAILRMCFLISGTLGCFATMGFVATCSLFCLLWAFECEREELTKERSNHEAR